MKYLIKFIFAVVNLSFVILYGQGEIKILDTKTNKEVSYKNESKWNDGSVMDDSKVDGVMYIKQNNKYYKREIDESINVKWFGAKGDGKTDDTKAFEDMLSYLSKMNFNYKVFIPEGEYIINRGLKIKGKNNLPIIQGAGMRNTILNFSKSKDNFCVQLGEKNMNSLNGGITDLQINGNRKNDGLIIFATAPYAVAWCNFENLFFTNVNNGITEDANVIFFSSHFSNIHIQNYFGKAMVIHASYNTYSGIHIVRPSGQTSVNNPEPNYGENNLALEVNGINNTFYNLQCEDQLKILGGYNTFNNAVIEYIIKGANNSEMKDTAIFVAGAQTTFNNLEIIGLKKNKFNYLMTIFAENVTLINAKYEDERKIDQIIDYPYYPYSSSSGVMINCFANTKFKLDHPAFLKDTQNWSFINVEGSNEKIFSRIKNQGYKYSNEERNKLTPEEGMEIFNTTTKSKQFWNGSQWKTIRTD